MNERSGLWLEVQGEGAQKVELPLDKTLVVGSSSARAGFLVQGEGVADAHCAIGRTKEGDFAIKDLGSRAGTLLNDQRVTSARLKPGDKIVIGSRALELRTAPRANGGAKPPARAAAAPKASEPLPFQRLGGYKVDRLLGRGAMGAVYLALQESLRRPVALKVLAPKLAADGDFVRRFQAEARAAAALSHPNVVVVYDVGEEDGHHYLSMEFMAGGSLEQRLASAGPLPWRKVLDVLADAASGLAFAEAKKIVHRDIKPANLMLSGTGTVKIADLGLATTLESEGYEPVDGKKIFGTPHFVSPEQARGEPVDHRSDLYSLGATAYRLLSGRTPFEGASTRDILRALQTEPPRPLEELIPGLPAELSAVIARLMAKQPAARFHSADALKKECERLRLYADHGGPPSTEARGRRGLFAALALLLVAGAGVAWFFLGRETRPPTGAGEAGSSASAARGERASDDPFFEGGASEAARVDEEAAVRAREREARLTLAALPGDRSDAERIEDLRAFAERYAGTAAAHAASAELERLETGAESSDASTNELFERTQAELALCAPWPPPEGRAERPVEVLQALLRFRPPPALEADPRFEELRAQRMDDVLSGAARSLAAELERARTAVQGGDFTTARAIFTDLTARLEGLDSLALESGKLARLRELGAEVRERASHLDADERDWSDVVARARATALAAALGRGSGLATELAALDFGALESRVGSFTPEVAGEPSARSLSRALPPARAALLALTEEHARGGWRRKSLLDPRTKKPREVQGASMTGLVFEKEGGGEPATWRELAADPDWWQQLFRERLAREYTASEQHGIASLLHLVGAARAAELALLLLDPTGRGILQPAELDLLAHALEPALAWSSEHAGVPADERTAIEREARAAELVAAGLGAYQERAWTSAIVALERLLAEHADTLLVQMLSDGSPWRLPPPPEPATPEAPQKPAESAAQPPKGSGAGGGK